MNFYVINFKSLQTYFPYLSLWSYSVAFNSHKRKVISKPTEIKENLQVYHEKKCIFVERTSMNPFADATCAQISNIAFFFRCRNLLFSTNICFYISPYLPCEVSACSIFVHFHCLFVPLQLFIEEWPVEGTCLIFVQRMKVSWYIFNKAAGDIVSKRVGKHETQGAHWILQ